MQGGSSRPGFWTDFVQNADAIAVDIVTPLRTAAPATSAALSIQAVSAT